MNNPITTISRERLMQLSSYKHVSSVLGHEIGDMARALLAVMDAKPYGYVHKNVYEQCGVAALSSDHEAYVTSTSHVPLYTTPPAPSAPDLLQEIFESCNSETVQRPDWVKTPKDMVEWISGRSAPDGWIKCSDRMPEQKQSNRYVALNLLLNERTVAQGGFDDGEFWIDGVVVNNVTRWMPLPAAPEN